MTVNIYVLENKYWLNLLCTYNLFYGIKNCIKAITTTTNTYVCVCVQNPFCVETNGHKN